MSEARAIRPMREHDLPAIDAIEGSAYEFPWTRGLFADCLRAGYCCWTLAVDEAIAGYGILSIAAGEAHLLNLCVAPQMQRRGHARALLHWLLQVAREHAVEVVFLEVRPSNTAAIALYLDEGFVEIGVRRNYYPAREGREDALVFTLRLDPAGQARLG